VDHFCVDSRAQDHSAFNEYPLNRFEPSASTNALRTSLEVGGDEDKALATTLFLRSWTLQYRQRRHGSIRVCEDPLESFHVNHRPTEGPRR
jgi:hypothetical protein